MTKRIVFNIMQLNKAMAAMTDELESIVDKLMKKESENNEK